MFATKVLLWSAEGCFSCVALSGISLMTSFLVAILCTFESRFACPLIIFICKYTSCFKVVHLFLYTFFSPNFVTHLSYRATTICSPPLPLHTRESLMIIYIYRYIYITRCSAIWYIICTVLILLRLEKPHFKVKTKYTA